MNPKIWGPAAWKFIHSVSLAYPINPSNEEKENMLTFITILPKILPCEKCRYNCMTHMGTLQITDDILSSRDKLIKWFIDLHNCVNKMNGSKVFSYTEAIETFDNDKSYSITSSIILIIIFLILICFLLYARYYS